MDRPTRALFIPFVFVWLKVKSIALIVIDIRDVLYFSGLASLWYGIHLVLPWLAFVVCGCLLMITGYIMGEK